MSRGPAARCFSRARCRCSARWPAGAQRGARLWTATGTFGAAVGPALGGVLTQLADWRAIFVVQAPIAAAALVATFDRRVHELPVEERAPKRRGATVANAGLALVFGGLVGALFLSVLLVITVWERRPIVGALIVSALPVAAFLVRPLASRLGRREAATAGALLLAAGLVALALLPAISDTLLAISLAFCGLGLGLAVPGAHRRLDRPGARTASQRDDHGRRATPRSRRRGRADRAAPDPRARREPDSGDARGHARVMDGNIDLTKKIPIALAMRDEFVTAQRGEIPDLAKPFNDRGAKSDSGLRALRDTLLDTLRGAVTRAFRSSFFLSALFALLALIPGPHAPREGRGDVTRLSGSRIVLLVLGAAAVALIVVELGMGAIGFGKANLANPCTSKPHLSEGGIFGSVDAAIQRFALSGLNGAACSLHASREELVLSFAPALGTKKVRWDTLDDPEGAARRVRAGRPRHGRERHLRRRAGVRAARGARRPDRVPARGVVGLVALGRRPGPGERVLQVRGGSADRQPLLGQRVAFADRDRVVLERLVVDRERERGADLVLPAVAAADRAAVVVLDEVPLPQLLVQRRAPSRPCPRSCRSGAGSRP